MVLVKDDWVSENHWRLEHEHKSVKKKNKNDKLERHLPGLGGRPQRFG